MFLIDEYLDFCERYPVYHIKCIRSHILKMLYRYVSAHEHLRNKCGLCNQVSHFRAFIQEIRDLLTSEEPSAVIETDVITVGTSGEKDTKKDKYWITWYNRHRFDTDVNGGTSQRKPIVDPDDLLNLKDSFLRGNGEWEDGEDCGGIFAALGMFGGEE
jgi:hypothetical protein